MDRMDTYVSFAYRRHWSTGFAGFRIATLLIQHNKAVNLTFLYNVPPRAVPFNHIHKYAGVDRFL